MNSNHKIVRGMVAAVLLIPAGLLRAQQQGASSGPIGPITSIQTRQMPIPVARVNDNGNDRDLSSPTLEMHPDTHTLASIETLTFGTLGALTSFVDPSFRFAQSGESGTLINSDAMSSMGVHLDFNENWKRSRLTGSYAGARAFRYPSSSTALASETYHDLNVAEELNLDRWVFRIREDLLSSPEATLGGMDIAGLILSGGSGTLNTLQPGAGAADTILTQPAKRLRTTTSGEINYYLSRRSILTATSSYSTLTFSSAGFIDSHRIDGRTGYDYLLSSKDTIGLIYDYSLTRFGAGYPNLQTDSVQFAFGHRLTGRLVYQLMGGPQAIVLGAETHQLTWILSNNISYQTRRTAYSLAYNHGASSTSGVFAGSSSHAITGSVHRSLTQWWSVSTAASYAFNTSLVPTSGLVSQFGSWSGTASLERALGRHFHLTLNYGFQQQSAGSGACPATGCSPSMFRQTAGAALDWHPFFVGAR